MTMDVKGITWVGNIYQKFENMCLEVEEVMLEDTVKYIENQMQTVGESVKKIYSEVMEDLLPLSSHDLDEKVASELPIEQYADNGLGEKTFQDSEEMIVKADAKETTEKDSRVNRDVNNDAIHDESCDGEALFKSAFSDSIFENNSALHPTQAIGNTDVGSNLGGDENHQNKETPAFKTIAKITLSETDACSTSQSCELSKENQKQNHADAVSNPASAEVFCCNEIEKETTEQSSNVLLLVKSADEKEIHMSNSSSSVVFEDINGFSVIKTRQPDDCSHNTVVSHPEITEGWGLDATMIDSIVDHGHETMQQDRELMLEETCVMVTTDEFQLVPKTGGNLHINKCLKKKRQQPFSLSKKSARKQEYEELAIWHVKNEKFKGDNVENLCPASVKDQNKLLLADISEPEWELL